MKNLMLAITALLVTAQVHARSMKVVATAQLTQFNFQIGSDLAKQDIKAGSVSLDIHSRQITLVLQPSMNCPAGELCAEMMPAPITITLPLIGSKIGTCGESIFTAEKNELPVDGSLQRITLVSNTGNLCKTLVAVPPVELVLEIQGGRPFFQERHVMFGSALK